MVMVGSRLKSKKRFLALTSALETVVAYDDCSKYELMIDAATQIKDLLLLDNAYLSRSDKIRIVKSVTRAKVKAFRGGTPDSYSTFKTLETISSDLVKLL